MKYETFNSYYIALRGKHFPVWLAYKLAYRKAVTL